jgi:hypothetical protein
LNIPVIAGPVQMSGWMTAGGEIMSVAVAEHTGRAADDADALPDAGDHARFEVCEGGVLVVSPAPEVGHQGASCWLHRALAKAVTAAGADAEVLEAVDVAIAASRHRPIVTAGSPQSDRARRPLLAPCIT